MGSAPTLEQDQDQTGIAQDLAGPGAKDTAFQAQIQLEESVVKEISQWLQTEANKALARRSTLEDRLNTLKRTYEAKPEQDRKSFPWDGASNLVVPVAATAVETVLTRITGSIFGAPELYAGRSRSSNWAEAVDPMVTWLNWVNDNVFDSKKVYTRWILSCIKYGTSVVKLPWHRRIREVNYMDASGGQVSDTVVLHDGPKPEFVPLEDFFWSEDANATQSIQDCEWTAQRFYQTWKQLKEAELSGDYYDVDRIKDSKRTEFKESETDTQEATGVQPESPGDYELWEFWASYPVKEDGSLAEIVVTLHRETGIVIRAVYNFYRHQERPFHMIKFFPREDSILGIGLIEMLIDVQEEVTAIHRNRLDNATIANAKVYKRTSGANVQFDEIFPGAVIDVENQDDLTEMDMGSEHGTLLMEEQHTITIGEKRSGVSDYTVGRESSAIGSRATATSTMALIREGNRRFQFLIREVRTGLTDIGHQTVSLYQQFAPKREVFYELFSAEEQQWFNKYMTLPAEFSRANFAIDVKALDDQNNKEIQQQTYMTMLQVIQETYMKMGEAMMIISNPQAPPPIKELASQGSRAASKLIERLLESFDFKDAETFVPDVEKMISMTAAMEMAGAVNGVAQGTNNGTGEQAPGPGMGPGGPAPQGTPGQAGQGAPPGGPAPSAGGPNSGPFGNG
jgi:hypothetical protein